MTARSVIVFIPIESLQQNLFDGYVAGKRRLALTRIECRTGSLSREMADQPR